MAGSVSDIFSKAGDIRTPLALAAVVLAVLFLLYRQLLRRATRLSGGGTERVVRYLFILALCSILLGFFGYVISQILMVSGTRLKVYGRVYEAGNEAAAIPDATVYFRLDTVTTIPVDAQGDFSTVLPRSYDGRTASLWATAPQYERSAVRTVVLATYLPSQDITLVRIFGGSPSNQRAACLTGRWIERPGGAYYWLIRRTQYGLRLERMDGDVSGDFVSDHGFWSGTLHWRVDNTDWHGVTLAADSHCTQVNTNKSWWYQRVQ